MGLEPGATWGGKSISFQHPQLMGVLNITPDSFSDGGELYRGDQVNLEAVVRRARNMAQAGAAILDIGGESTRPGATPVSEDEELARVLPVIKALQGMDIILSVDTRHTRVAAAAIEAGVHLINDISAGRDEAMLELVAQSSVGYVLMHMQGTPRDMQADPHYRDVENEVFEFLQQRIDACQQAGISKTQLVADPGFGFGKTLQHNLSLLRGLKKFAALSVPVLVGLSRKSMLAKITGRAVHDRVHASIAAGLIAVQHGANILRVHDVAASRDMLQVFDAVNSPANPVGLSGVGINDE